MNERTELLAAFDPRHLAHRADDIARIEAFRDAHAEHMPVVVEIGSNRGAFLEGQARSNAPNTVLGLEWREKHCRFATERMERKGLTNALVLHADARLALPILFEPGTLDAVCVTFPDPWWKKGHANRRVLDPLFMRVIARRLKPGGRLYLKSDVFDYLHRVRQFAESSLAFRPLPPERWPDESAWSLTTRERKCMRAAIPFGRGYYERLASFDGSIPAVPERAEDYAIDENLSATEFIRGPAPIDREAHRAGARRPGGRGSGH